ncbi:MAG TPA: conjugal transfer protein TrbF [Sphingomicrobium sp.]|jgi:type IV secretion system protein VirB5|nr:conjugal transfer protein TrbF [Sphingomicrobium sp.]
MKFRRAVQRYGRTPEPQTPYQRAAQVWDERLGSARVQARNWRLMAFGGLVLSAALSGCLFWQSMQSRVVPYVVAVDHLGEARAVAPADRDYQPTDPQIAWFLARFITDVRSVSLDPVLMRQDWLSAYDFASARGARFLSAYARDANPFGEIGTRTVSVQLTSVVRASDRSFELKWTESEFERGSPAGTSHWTGILSIVRKPPSSADALRRNPLGLYVDGIDWSQEIETAEPKSTVSPVPTASANPMLGSPLNPAFPQVAQPSPSTRSIP